MRTPAALPFAISCRRALPVIVGTLIAGAAWADNGVMPPIPLDRAGIAADGSNKPPPPAPITVASRAAPTPIAQMPQGASGGDDRRLFMLMMMGRAVSGGPFGQLGQ